MFYAPSHDKKADTEKCSRTESHEKVPIDSNYDYQASDAHRQNVNGNYSPNNLSTNNIKTSWKRIHWLFDQRIYFDVKRIVFIIKTDTAFKKMEKLMSSELLKMYKNE